MSESADADAPGRGQQVLRRLRRERFVCPTTREKIPSSNADADASSCLAIRERSAGASPVQNRLIDIDHDPVSRPFTGALWISDFRVACC